VPVLLGTIKTDRPLKVMSENWGPLLDLELPSVFTEAWFKDNLPILRERAIDDPTEANVRKYFIAQKAMLDMAEKKANSTTYPQ
ncbi:conjugal transfer protein TraF, partial [Vibrio parahaemolyticus]|nr:conjugal transfer protein TraF [Vibrio parahaemolyticus]MDF5143997.1 conjugal transfer protein TraF [Vibrio parahaemolyticus]MDF5154424.1 conjugal transfer protein TraF [Vibrio parahaemolyticus]